jgi:phage terminase large subunit-like protein
MPPTQAEAVVTVPPFDFNTPTLGVDVIDWMETWLTQADGPNAGEPFRLTTEQKHFLLHYYALDSQGRFAYRRAVLRRPKGHGKSPFMAAIALAELCGPVRFGGWDDNGDPIGVEEPMPWVQIAGVSEKQTRNTYDAVMGMAQDPDFQAEYGLDVGLTRILGADGAKLEMVTASASTLEGARPTFVILDETHHWTATNGGHALQLVIRRNLGKTGGRSIETTNAHEPGQDSTAERSYLTYRAMAEGRARRADMLYDSREAPADIDLADEAALREGLRMAYGDATWVDLDRVIGEIYDPDTPPEEARRFYLNQIVAAADAWVLPTQWNSNRNPDLAPLKLGDANHSRGWRDGDTVALGFDGSLTDDSTALVAVRIEDGAPFLLGVWEKPEGPDGAKWEVPKDVVRGVVDNAFARLDVIAFFSDVAYWETDIDNWRDAYAERLRVKATTRHAVGWDMRGHQMETTHAVEALHRAITDKQLPWTPHVLLSDPSIKGDEVLTRHVSNARRRLNRWGVYFGKENRESPKKVDALAALVLARMARERVRAEGKQRRSAGRVAAF